MEISTLFANIRWNIGRGQRKIHIRLSQTIVLMLSSRNGIRINITFLCNIVLTFMPPQIAFFRWKFEIHFRSLFIFFLFYVANILDGCLLTSTHSVWFLININDKKKCISLLFFNFFLDIVRFSVVFLGWACWSQNSAGGYGVGQLYLSELPWAYFRVKWFVVTTGSIFRQ